MNSQCFSKTSVSPHESTTFSKKNVASSKATVFILLSIGIIFSNKNLRGSCGESCECTLAKKIRCQFSNIKSNAHMNN